MPSGFPNQPKILRGAFVEYGLSIPPLILPFQFNPDELTRSRNISFSVPGTNSNEEYKSEKGEGTGSGSISLRDYHQGFKNLIKLRDAQQVEVQEESISFKIRLDATDKLNEGDILTEQFGIAPQLSTLELMAYPKSESILKASSGFSFTKSKHPPMILFIWGRNRVLPVNIDSMDITETEFSPALNPIRAEVSVKLTVIEGPNSPYTFSKASMKAMSSINLANLTNITNVVIPE